MLSKGLEGLSSEDLHYLEKLIGDEFAKACEYVKTFDRKNGWQSDAKTQKLFRIMNALRQQQANVRIKSQKW
jgi:hypothetical protein